MNGDGVRELGRVLREGVKNWQASARLCVVATVVVVDWSLMDWLLGR